MPAERVHNLDSSPRFWICFLVSIDNASYESNSIRNLHIYDLFFIFAKLNWTKKKAIGWIISWIIFNWSHYRLRVFFFFRMFRQKHWVLFIERNSSSIDMKSVDDWKQTSQDFRPLIFNRSRFVSYAGIVRKLEGYLVFRSLRFDVQIEF